MDIEKYVDIVQNECSEQFKRFSEILSEHNKMYNLTSVLDGKGVLYKHFTDSLAGENFIPENSYVIEIGSGGGFPSIPLKIYRKDLKFTLIESTGKKCRHLKEVVEMLVLDCVQVENIRAEEGAHNKKFREKADIVVARAVAQLNILCEYCLPFLKVGGLFIAYKGSAEEEIKGAQNALKVLGGKIENVIEYELPEGFGKRQLVCIRKIQSTPILYPRGNGRERKNPL